MTAHIVSVCISERKGTQKQPVPAVDLRENHGIVGDAHAGEWDRQVSLLAVESVDKMRKLGAELDAGAFGENINTVGIDLLALPIGTHLQVGPTLLEVTKIGKECHQHCAIYHQVGDCVMPREGIFARVLRGGAVKGGDPVTVLESGRD